MSAQQIKSNINTLVNSIEDESILDVCYEVLSSLVKIAKKNQKDEILNEEVETVIPHDLSLAFLANDIFKGTGPIPEEGAIAFKKALLKSATTKPVFTNAL